MQLGIIDESNSQRIALKDDDIAALERHAQQARDTLAATASSAHAQPTPADDSHCAAGNHCAAATQTEETSDAGL